MTFEILWELLVNEVGEVATIIENHVEWLSVFECRESLLDAPEILLFGLAFPRVNRDTSRGNTRETMNCWSRRKLGSTYAAAA